MRTWMLLIPSLILAAAAATSTAAHPASSARGAALYHGKEPLLGRIRGHDDPLPAEAIVCANCHSAPRGATNSRLVAQPAPQLDRAFLTGLRQRHGGPPSSYNQQSFCRLLRTGSDPAYVLIAREMPAYDLNDEQCASLWTYLLTLKN